MPIKKMKTKVYKTEIKRLSLIRSERCLVQKSSSEACNTLMSESVAFNQHLMAVVSVFFITSVSTELFPAFLDWVCALSFHHLQACH